jgi:hypothetical protein
VLLVLALLLLAPDTAVEEAETKAQQALAAARVAEALEHFETAIRAADDTPTKLRLRDAYTNAGWAEPRRISLVEANRLGVFIRSERIRVYTKAAQDCENNDQRHAAIILRRAIAELAGGKRAEEERKKIKKIVRDLTEGPTAEEKELVDKLLKDKKSGPALLKAGRKLLKRRSYRAAVRLCQQIMFGEFDQETQNEALELRREAEATAVRDISPKEKARAAEVMDDRRFERLHLARSRHFLFLGPNKFISALPKDQLTRLDLAYIFQSDLSGQYLTANGVRVVVYYQETLSTTRRRSASAAAWPAASSSASATAPSACRWRACCTTTSWATASSARAGSTTVSPRGWRTSRPGSRSTSWARRPTRSASSTRRASSSCASSSAATSSTSTSSPTARRPGSCSASCRRARRPSTGRPTAASSTACARRSSAPGRSASTS